MVMLILVLAFSPVLLVVFGRYAWNGFCRMVWDTLVHPSERVVTLPAGWRRVAIRLFRPPHKEAPVLQKHVS